MWKWYWISQYSVFGFGWCKTMMQWGYRVLSVFEWIESTVQHKQWMNEWMNGRLLYVNIIITIMPNNCIFGIWPFPIRLEVLILGDGGWCCWLHHHQNWKFRWNYDYFQNGDIGFSCDSQMLFRNGNHSNDVLIFTPKYVSNTICCAYGMRSTTMKLVSFKWYIFDRK